MGVILNVKGLGFRADGLTLSHHARIFSKDFGFPQMRGSLFRGPYNQDSNIFGSILGSPYLGKLPLKYHDD